MWKKPRYGLIIGLAVFLFALNFFLAGIPGAIEFLIGGWLVLGITGGLSSSDSTWPLVFVHGIFWPFALVIAYVLAKEVYKPKNDAPNPDKNRTTFFYATLFALSLVSSGLAYFATR